MKTKERLKLKNRIFACSGEGMIVSTFSGKIKDLNRIAAKIFGYRKNEMVGRNIDSIMPSLAGISDLKTFFPGGMDCIKKKFIVNKKNGSAIEVECRLNRYEEKNGEGLIIFISPTPVENVLIKETRLPELTLPQQKSKITDRNGELRELAYVTTHHLQEPLRKIEVYCDLIKNSESEKANGQEEVSSVINLARQARSMIENLRFYLEISTEELKPDRVELYALVNEVMSEIKDRLKDMNYLVDLYELPLLNADREKLKLLFRQLADNAVRFKKENEPLSIFITGKYDPKEKNITIFFRDNGHGFDTKYCVGIFKLFGRLNNNKNEGAGMGLAICRRILEKHGGKIKVESNPGNGTQFELTWPRQLSI